METTFFICFILVQSFIVASDRLLNDGEDFEFDAAELVVGSIGDKLLLLEAALAMSCSLLSFLW